MMATNIYCDCKRIYMYRQSLVSEHEETDSCILGKHCKTNGEKDLT